MNVIHDNYYFFLNLPAWI